MFTVEEKKKLYAAGISRQLVAFWKAKKAIPKLKTRQRIAAALGVSVMEVGYRFLSAEVRGDEASSLSVLSGTDGPTLPDGPPEVLLGPTGPTAAAVHENSM